MDHINFPARKLFELAKEGNFSDRDLKVVFQLSHPTIAKWKKGESEPKQIYLDVLQLLVERPELSLYFGLRQTKTWEPLPEIPEL